MAVIMHFDGPLERRPRCCDRDCQPANLPLRHCDDCGLGDDRREERSGKCCWPQRVVEQGDQSGAFETERCGLAIRQGDPYAVQCGDLQCSKSSREGRKRAFADDHHFSIAPFDRNRVFFPDRHLAPQPSDPAIHAPSSNHSRIGSKGYRSATTPTRCDHRE
jgi:hypothetical protein